MWEDLGPRPRCQPHPCPEALKLKPVFQILNANLSAETRALFYFIVSHLGLWVTKEDRGNTALSVATSYHVDSPEFAQVTGNAHLGCVWGYPIAV